MITLASSRSTPRRAATRWVRVRPPSPQPFFRTPQPHHAVCGPGGVHNVLSVFPLRVLSPASPDRGRGRSVLRLARRRRAMRCRRRELSFCGKLSICGKLQMSLRVWLPYGRNRPKWTGPGLAGRHGDEGVTPHGAAARAPITMTGRRLGSRVARSLAQPPQAQTLSSPSVDRKRGRVRKCGQVRGVRGRALFNATSASFDDNRQGLVSPKM